MSCQSTSHRKKKGPAQPSLTTEWWAMPNCPFKTVHFMVVCYRQPNIHSQVFPQKPLLYGAACLILPNLLSISTAGRRNWLAPCWSQTEDIQLPKWKHPSFSGLLPKTVPWIQPVLWPMGLFRWDQQLRKNSTVNQKKLWYAQPKVGHLCCLTEIKFISRGNSCFNILKNILLFLCFVFLLKDSWLTMLC